MKSLIVNSLEKYVTSKNVSVKYWLDKDMKGYQFSFPSFVYENTTIGLSVSMMETPINKITNLKQVIPEKGWNYPFYLWVKSEYREIKLCSFEFDKTDQEQIVNIIKALGTIFDLSFVVDIDVKKPTKGSYNIPYIVEKNKEDPIEKIKFDENCKVVSKDELLKKIDNEIKLIASY